VAESSMTGGALLSSDGRYRYSLWRLWAPGPRVAFVGLNPSTADATEDDPTIRRCLGFARALGAGGLWMYNLCPFRATDPDAMLAWARTEGKSLWIDAGTSRSLLLERMETFSYVIAAWGALNAYHRRGAWLIDYARKMERDVVDSGGQLHALGVTAQGHPRHPLYLPASAKPEPWGCP